ncbi:halo-acid dehalogenase-like hydrolase [Dunaliella salina]|uniref:Halo-acid dehalogenase-like hydrolase n=1 Tax=Dunaliella salina TaxID=3046 RepID=A0ABQ7H409_DUNSA|nr:halo-acid dehalogenase-like hydrolase [Dunaliella salina]|eukprot:KAF5841594.1 halo-acid dehalogenase-like hydrolase [Dunaliella salina]
MLANLNRRLSTPLSSTPSHHLSKPSVTRRAAAMAPATAGKTLVSFDVDGTLIRSRGLSANKLHKDAYAQAFKEIFNLDTHIDVIQHHGSTDPLIAIMVLEHHGISKEDALKKMPQLNECMIKYYLEYAKTRAGEGLEKLAGVEELLRALKAHPDAVSCLAAHKGRVALKLDGENGAPLGDLASLAGKNEGLDNGWSSRVHVGDTPMDIKAALAAGAKALGVATGVFSKEQLEACAPGNPNLVVVESFEDTAATLAAMGLSPSKVAAN